MSVVVDAEAVMQAPSRPAASEGVDAAEAMEDIIAAHRAALVDLAPHQAWRSVRLETAWHIAELGLLLRVRDGRGERRCGDEALRGTGRERDTELPGLNGVAEGDGPR